jgi:sodium/hydrogen antiporter
VLLSLIAVSLVLAAWALGAGRLERWRLTAPMVLVLAGIAVGFVTRDVLADSLNTETLSTAPKSCWPYCFSSTP